MEGCRFPVHEGRKLFAYFMVYPASASFFRVIEKVGEEERKGDRGYFAFLFLLLINAMKGI